MGNILLLLVVLLGTFSFFETSALVPQVYFTKSKQNKNILVARPEEGSPRNAWMFFLIHSRAAI